MNQKYIFNGYENNFRPAARYGRCW